MASSQSNRRDLLRMAGATGLFGATASGWLPALAAQAATAPDAGKKRRHCILLWMSGGPSQTDTFDMKPGHENGGEFKEISTNAPGVRFSEHLPGLAKHADKLAIVRSLNTKEGDHERGSHLMRTGKPIGGPIRYPAIGAALAKQLAVEGDALPPYVSVAPYVALSRSSHGPGFLGPKFAPLVVGGGMTTAPALAANSTEAATAGFAQLRVDAVRPPSGVSKDQMASRLDLWRHLQDGFVNRHPLASPVAHQTIYDSALQMISSDAATAFDLEKEPVGVREKYGRGVFGQGCLLARRLVERGVPFVEVTLNQTQATTGTFGWDTHANNFQAVKSLSAELDAGWASLMTDLAERDLLDSTTILWMGEFGRTPQINGSGGRDHFPAAWSCVLGGGGIAGGQAYGKTSADGMTIEENPVDATDVLATLCEALGIDPSTEEYSASGRPFPVIDGTAIGDLLA